jgi:proteasome lid subunit RPN8/RPN11
MLTTRVVLSAGTGDAVRSRASLEYPSEACGLLIGRRRGGTVVVTDAPSCQNLAAPDDRRRRFVIDPRRVLQAERHLRDSGDALVGFYHSHPDARAVVSETDMQYLRLWPNTVWLIVPVARGRAATPRAWWLDTPGEGPGRELEVQTVGEG